jgi:hypothetical protein
MVNVDAAIYLESRQMGCGVVSCDHRVSFFQTCGCFFQRVTDPDLVEALADRYMLSCASSNGHCGILERTRMSPRGEGG